MNKVFLAAAFAATAAFSTVAHAQVSTAWANPPGGVGIAVDDAENVYTARGVYNPGGDIFVAKRNAAGVLQWEASFDNTDSTKHELATWVATDSRGNVIVTGTIRSGYSNPVNANSVVMKFAPDGRLLWRRVYDQFFDGSSTRKALVDEANNIYVLSLGGTGTAGMVSAVRKFSPDGATQWIWADRAGIGSPVNFKWTGDGAIVIAGRSIYGSINGYAKIDRNGSTVWTLAGINSLTVGDVAGDAQGNSYLINGEYVLNGGSVLRKVSPGGATLWERSHPMAGFRVEVGTDGAPVVSGFPNSGTGGAAFMKFDGAGNLLWTNLDADGPALGLLAHAQMKLDSANSAYLAAGTMSEMGVVKVASDGRTAWVTTVPFGYSQALDLGASGAVYVVGGTTAKLAQQAGTPTDLALALTSAQTSVIQGSTVSYRSTVSNLGPAAATGVTVTGTLPACYIGNLAVGASASCSSSVTATTPGTLTQTMNVTSGAADPVPGNNTATVSTQVLAPLAADLSVALTDAPDPVAVGGTLVYTATITNLGPGDAAGVTLTDTLPSGFTLVGTSGGSCSGAPTVTCALGTVARNASQTITITVRPDKRGTYTNTARVSSQTTDSSSANNTASVTTRVTRR